MSEDSMMRNEWADQMIKELAAQAQEIKALREELDRLGRCADCTGHKDPWIRESVFAAKEAENAALRSGLEEAVKALESLRGIAFGSCLPERVGLICEAALANLKTLAGPEKP